MAANLVAAVQQALADTDDPSTPDPLAACAVLLRQVIARDLSYDLATRYVLGTFAALPQPDQDTDSLDVGRTDTQRQRFLRGDGPPGDRLLRRSPPRTSD
jgi:hypothetical protein